MNFKDIKSEFKILTEQNITYLDSGATSQKPREVLEKIEHYYKSANANPHRGAYKLSIAATEKYNEARHAVANFIGAKFDEEIIFTKNATESLNLIAYSYGIENLNEGDEVVISIMEHHSNLVPWQKITALTNSKLNYIYLDENYELSDAEIESKITSKTKIVSVLSVSNVLGTINNLSKIVKKAHEVGAIVIADISQSVAHMPFNAQECDVDFAVFSAHKMYGPLGVGVLYGKKALLEKMPPFIMGGDMIEYVYEQETTFADLPNKFEAGTQNVGGAVGLAAAIEFIQKIGFEEIQKHEKELISYAIDKLSALPYITLYASKNKEHISSVISFNMNGIHPHDMATLLDGEGVCIRAGNHCAQPLMRYLKIDSTCRVSFGIYNTLDDIDKLIFSLEKIHNKFKKFFN